MSDGAAAFALDRAVLAAAWEGVATDVLEEVGLEGALRSLAQQAASRGSLKLTLDLGYAQRHSQEQLLFSAARELLANVIEHAEATTVRVRLGGVDDELALVVEDDGHGFNPDQLADRLADGHVGLASQRVRIEAAGGSMNLASSPGRGTRVEIRVSNKH
jgi:two-component system NarL family sensor kinase